MELRRRTVCALLVALLASATPTFAQNCSPPPDIVTSPDDLTPLSSCTTITGDLTIGYRNCSESCTVRSFSALGSLQEIQGSLRIQCCNLLESISDFGSLLIIRDSLVFYYNRELTTIDGFRMLQDVTNIEISQNVKLQVVTGLQRVGTIGGYLLIDRNTALQDLDGFRNLQLIRGDELVSGHALSVLYNTALTHLSGFVNLNGVSYGTVRIEGNTELCYAGHPQWNVNSFPLRPPGGDMGIDWRTILQSSERWQFDWEEEGGFPTLLIQNNTDYDSCAQATCHSTCPTGAGCLGPSDENLCGTCDSTLNNCQMGDPPSSQPPTSAPCDSTSYQTQFWVVLAFLLALTTIVLLVLVGVGVFVGVRVWRRLKEGRQGSFDINSSSSSHSMDSNIELVPTGDYRRPPRKKAPSRTTGNIAEPVSLREKQPTLDTVIMSSYRQKSDPPSSAPETTSPMKHKPPPQRLRLARQVPGRRAMRSSKSSPVVIASYKQRTSSASSLTEQRLPTASPTGPTTTTTSSKTVSPKTSVSSVSRSDTPRQDESADIPMRFPRDQIKLVKEFGVGDFGKVYQAEAKRLIPRLKKTTVMLKQLKENATEEERETFLRPVEAMKVLRHPNVLSLLGVCSEGKTLMVILEYCAQGNFKTYLVRKRTEATALKHSGQLLSMASDMAAGLMYLHSMNIAHNDFAVRSCVVMGDCTVKVGDYGLSRQIFKEDYYTRSPKQQAWPIRWMAPEQIVVQGRNILDAMPTSMPGNIWSFGVALWEVCSFAQWPYEELSNEEVIHSIKTTEKCSLENPLQPDEPLGPLYDMMNQCWQSPQKRPSMGELVAKLQELRNGTGGRPVKPVKQEKQVKPETQAKLEKQVKPEKQAKPEKTPVSPTETEPGRRLSRPQKPRRPAPKKPPTQNMSTRKLRKETSAEPLLLSTSSLEGQSSTERLPSLDGTTSLKRPPKKTDSFQQSRSLSADPLLTDESSLPEEDLPMRDKGNPLFNQDQTYADKDMVGMFPGATEEDDDFILEPPEDFSQSSIEKEEEGFPAAKFAMEDDNEFSYNFGPDDDDEDSDSPMMARRGPRIPVSDIGHIARRTKEQQERRVSAGNPLWLVDESHYDQFDRRDALEEDDVPNVVYDDEVAALIW